MMMMKRLKPLVLLILFLPTFLLAQSPKQANIWYFGDKAGLDFSNGDPVALTNSSLSSMEGVSVVSDANTGQLKFYTNGGDFPYDGGIWNRNHQLMPNGDLTGAGGCNSSVQSSLILTDPANRDVHYIFNTDCQENAFADGLSYSIVDMNMDGGLGDVVIKGNSLSPMMNESLSAIAHGGGNGYWVISHKVNTDSFYVYHLSKSGITGVVKSKIGNVVGQFAGELSVSANGEKLALHGTSFTGLFDFDANTGKVSNFVNLGQGSSFGAFSPDCQLLYMSDLASRSIYQFDIYAGHQVATTKTLVADVSPSLPGAIRVGPNRRMYVTKNNATALDIIYHPNFRGTNCTYGKDSLDLNGKVAKMGLPSYPSDIVGECVPYPVQSGSDMLVFQQSRVGPSNVTFNVANLPMGAAKLKIAYQQAGEEAWEKVDITDEQYTLTGLEPGQEYEVKLLGYEQEDGSIYEYVEGHGLNELLNDGEETSTHRMTVRTLDEFEVSIYPNPVVSSAKVDVNFGDEITDVDVAVYSVSGQLFYQNNISGASGHQTLEIPTDVLPNGMYNVSVTSETMSGKRRFVVMR